MRWKIETKTNTYNTEEDIRRDTTITKTQYVTVGDIVEASKSAAGAVKKLAKNMPAFINQIRSNPKEYGKAMLVNNLVMPLLVMTTGMEEYQKVVGIVDTLTPIAKSISAATGMWCSPGNSVDLAQTVLGTVKQILIGVLSASLVMLKEKVFSYEFEIREISSTTSEIIGQYIKQLQEELNNSGIVDESLFGDTDELMNTIDGVDTDSLIDDDGKVDIGIEDALDIITDRKHTEEEQCQRRDSYITEEITEGNKRLLSGSDNNKGIYYSDDNGKTWKQSDKKTGSFNAFAKIKTGDSYIYVAGSTKIINDIDPYSDEKFSRDINGQYNKDYYDINKRRLSKRRKDALYNKTKDELSLYVYQDVSSFSEGILYSSDGITWLPSNIKTGSFELFHEFEDTIVASSYDYKGVYYTENGSVWQHSKSAINDNDIDTGRWVFYNDMEDTINKMDSIGKSSLAVITAPEVSTIKEVSAAINITTFLRTSSYQGDNDFNGADIDNVNKIISYLHSRWTDKILKKDYNFWDIKIRDIINGNYTMEDAVQGRDI